MVVQSTPSALGLCAPCYCWYLQYFSPMFIVFMVHHQYTLLHVCGSANTRACPYLTIAPLCHGWDPSLSIIPDSLP